MWQTLTIINPGELKSTFMHSFMREANFQALLSDDSEMCSHVSDLVEVYEAFQTEDVHKIHLAHMVDAAHVTQPQPDPAYDETHLHESKLPNSALASFIQFLNCKYNVTTGSSNPSSNLNSLAHTIISLEASFLDSFSLQGVQYLTKNYRMHNSHILFWSIQGDASMAPGHSMPSQITHIFLHSLPPSLHSCTTQGSFHCQAVYVCVQPYGSLQPKLRDTDQTYRKFGFAGGFLCQRELAPVVTFKHCLSRCSNTIMHKSASVAPHTSNG